eukprot:scpid64075/ scgid6964/ 
MPVSVECEEVQETAQSHSSTAVLQGPCPPLCTTCTTNDEETGASSSCEDNDSVFEPSEPESGDDENYDPVFDRKFIVFEQNLDNLFQRCQECGEKVAQTSKTTQGSLLIVTAVCVSGHTVQWKSQPKLQRAPVGNLLLSAAILFSGCLYNTFSLFASLLNLCVMGKSVYYEIQRKMLCPVVNEAWSNHVGSLHILATDLSLKFIGDGRCDSTGCSAKYCTYTIKELSTDLIVDFELMHVSMTGNNRGTLEREGLRSILHTHVKKALSALFSWLLVKVRRSSSHDEGQLRNKQPPVQHLALREVQCPFRRS